MFKRTLSLLLVLCMVFTMAPAVFATDTTTAVDHSSTTYAEGTVAVIGTTEYSSLKEAVNAAAGGDTIKLVANVTLSEKITIKNNVTISGDATITRGIAGTIFAVDKNATLTLDGGIVIDGANDWTFDSENFYADLAAAKTTSTGAKDSYSASAEGGLVSTAQLITISATSGAVVMNKATIQNVWAENHNGASLFSVPAGATLTINDGALISDIRGSVAGQIKGTWIMNGGKITGVHGHNTNGCLTDIRGGTFTIKGGEICNNTLLGLNNNGSGILAQVYGTTSKLIVNGGNIHDNANFCPGGGWGSVVYLNRGGSFEMNGGTIGSGNSDKCTTICCNDPSSIVALNAGTINIAEATAGSYDSLLLGNITVGKDMTISGGDVRFCGTPDNTLVINGTINSNVLLRAENVTNNGVINGNVIITKDSWVGNDGSVTINGGTWNGEFTVDEGASLSITGGTFKNDVSEYLAPDCKIEKLADGTYGVTKLNVIEVATKAELDAAIANAQDGDVIRLTADIDYGTDHLKLEKAVILDLGGFTLTTGARNYGIAMYNGASVTNGKLNHAGTVAAIKVWDAKEISNLEIDVTGTSASGNTINGIVIQQNSVGVDSIKNVTIHSTSGQGVAVGIETYNCGDATEPVIGSMENVTIDAKTTGMSISAPCGTATNCTIKGGVSGIEIWIKGTYSATLALVNCTVEGGEQAVYAHDEFNAGVVNNGTLKLTADTATTFTSDSGVKLALVNSHESTITVPVVLTENAVAVVNSKYYEDFKAAVTAANAVDGGATVELLTGVTLGEMLTITGNVTINGGKITRDDAYTGTLFAVNAGAALTLDGGLVIDGGNEWTLNKELYNKVLKGENVNVTWADLITSEVGKPEATAPMFLVNGSVVANNVTVQNNYSSKSSNNGDYGVFKVEPNATLTMTGATVKHIVTGGANSVVHLSINSVWTINDGTLITDTFAAKNGGICRNDSGLLVMNGGEISNNKAINTNGTVVMLYKGSMEMNDGKICSNSGISGTNNGRCAPIYGHSTSTFIMNDGEICHNTGIGYAAVDLPSSIKAEINGGYIHENIATDAWDDNPEVNGNNYLSITGGTFTQDVSEWLVPDTGLVYDEATGTYTTTEHVYNLWFRDPVTGEQGTVGPLQGNDPASLIATGKLFYADYYVMELEVLSNAKIDETIVIDYPMTVNLNGYTLTTAATEAGNYVDAFTILADVTITGDGKIDARPSHGYTFYVGDKSDNSGNLTIKNGEFYGETSVVNNRLGTVTIEGGYFEVSLENEGDTPVYLLNCIDGNYKDGTAKIVVKGGSFKGFNPADNEAEIGDHTNFCDDGYCAFESNGVYSVAKAIAQVGDTYYTSLQAAVDAAQAGETVILLCDTTLSETVVIEENIILDLNGNTITGMLENKEELVINATNGGKIDGDSEAAVDNYGKLTINAGEFTGAMCAVYNNPQAELIITGGEFTAPGDYYATIENREGTLLITGGKIIATYYYAIVDTEGKTTISGGEIISANATAVETYGGEIVINDGKFTGKVIVENQAGNITVYGGTLVSNTPEYYYGLTCAYGGNTVIYGGTFERDYATAEGTSVKVADNYASIKNADGTWTVIDYIKYIKDELLAGHDVTLIKDIVVDGSMIESIPAPTNGNGKYPNYGIFNVVGDYDVTFDLNGHTITYNGHADFKWKDKTVNSCTVAHGIFFINDGADFTVIDSSENKTGTVKVYGLASGVYVVTPDTTATVKGGNWINEGCATCGGTNIFMYAQQGGELYIEDGYFNQALDSNNESYLVVNHGGQYSNSVIDYSKTKVVISGGTFVGMNPEEIKYINTDSSNKTVVSDEPVNGCDENLAGSQNSDGTWTVKPLITVVFNDISIVKGNEVPEITYTSNIAEIADGKTLVVETPYISNGVITTNNAYVQSHENDYVVRVTPGKFTETDAVASIGSVYYATLAEAIAAVKNGETITLLANCAETVTITQKAGLSFTINGNDKTYTGKITVKGRNNGAAAETLTIKNLNFATDVKSHIFIDATGSQVQNLTVENCKFASTAIDTETGSAFHNGVVAIKLKTAGNVTVKNCTADPVYYLVNNTSGGRNLVVDGCTVNGFYGIRVHNNIDAVIKNTTLNTSVHAIVLDAGNSAVTTIENCTIKVANTERYPVYFNAASGVRAVVVNGTNDFGVDNWFNIAGTADVKVVLNDANVAVPAGFVAKIGNTYYNTLANAIADAKTGDTVTLVKDVNIANENLGTLDGAYDTYYLVEGKDITVDLNGKTISGEYTGTRMLVGLFSTDNNGHLKLTGNGTVNVTATKKVYALIVNYEDGCSIIIENGTYKLDKASDCLIYSGCSADENEGVTVKGGNFELGNVGSNDNGNNGKPWIFNVLGSNQRHVKVTGGTFNYNISRQYWVFEVNIPEQYYCKDNGKGTWTVTEGAVAAVLYDVNGYTNSISFGSLADALAEADGKDIVKVLVNTAESIVMVPAGVTLDLNGKIVEVEYAVVAFGDIIDTASTVGGIKISNDVAAARTSLLPNNKYMPIYDTTDGCYKFFEYSTEYMSKAVNNKLMQFGVRLTFTNNYAYSVIANSTDVDFELVLNLTWENKKGPAIITTIDNEAVKTYATKAATQSANGGVVKTAIVVTISGINALDPGTEMSSYITIDSATGFTADTVTATYTTAN